jgi:hypothetical protein
MIFAGIDPGKEGAIAWMDEFRHGVEIHDCPRWPHGDYNRLEMLELLRRSKELGSGTLVVMLEEVHSMPNDGVVQAFTFGRGYGYWEMACTSVGAKLTTVKPEVWKRSMLAGLAKGKQTSVDMAARLFPDICKLLRGPKGGLRHDRAEAVLLAELCRRTWKTTNGVVFSAA